MNHGLVVAVLMSGILFGTPLLLAGLGELLAERSGVLNLGVEGMMLIGAVCGFWISQRMGTGSVAALAAAVVVAGAAGGLMALIHAFVSITLRANQIVSGLALTIFGGTVGLSSYFGSVGHLTGSAGHHKFASLNVLGLAHLPLVGPLLFGQNALVYISWLLVIALSFYLFRTKTGLHLRAVGESPRAADAMGLDVVRYRYLHTIAGGVLAGVAGGSYSLLISPSWNDGMTAGAGWIAIALVIFGFWNPKLVMIGAYLFGTVAGLGFTLQARGTSLPPEFFSSLPYLLTIVTLVLVSSVWSRRRLGAPAALGVPYRREEG